MAGFELPSSGVELNHTLLPLYFVQRMYKGGLLERFGNFLDSWPGKDRFGHYRFLPIFFLGGAAIELLMIHWRPNGVNFYDTFKAKKAKEKALERCKVWREVEEACKK